MPLLQWLSMCGTLVKGRSGMRAFEDLIERSDCSDYCVFAYETPNLGDCIQTLAILQHVRPKRFVLRDRITPQPDVTLVANGWMTHGPFPRNEDFKAIRWVGIHLSEEHRAPETADRLRQWEPIGCRDTLTAEFLQSHG